MGLFDAFKDFDLNSPQGQGIMAMAANLLAARDQPGGSLGGALGRGALAGMGAYTDAMQGQRRAKLQDMQMKQYEQQLQDIADARAEKQAIKGAYKKALAPKISGGMTTQGLLSGDFSPEYQSQMPSPDEIRQNLFRELSPIAPQESLEYLPQRAKIKDRLEIAGSGGEKLYQGVDEYGDPVGQPMPAYTAPIQINTGKEIQMVVPKAGMSFPVGMSPADAARLGLDQQKFNYQKQQDKIGAVGGMPGVKLPAGYYMQGGQAVPVPGTEAAMKAQDAMRAKQADADSAYRTLATIEQLRNHPGRATGTGLSSRIVPTNYIPGTDAYDFGVLNEQAQAGAFLQGVQALRGMGALTEAEGKKATAAIARLRTGQGDESYLNALNEYKDVINSGLERAGIQTNQQGKSGKTPMRGQVVDGYKFKGGNPADPNSWERQ